MKPIEPPDKHFLLAAQGWMELGDQLEAFRELKRIAPEFSRHPEVVNARLELYSQIRGEQGARIIADIISEFDLSELVIQVRRSRDSHAAHRKTSACRQTPCVPLRLPLLFAVPYNLACYACQLGNLTEAWEWLQVAVELCDATEIRNLALNDPDLEALWDRIKEL
ncbi:MAG: hypothetical protein HY735_29400 [Verrucomicrobia bacterium]|nr:hypothetical protein [Verrucomicrobiota bacterium]